MHSSQAVYIDKVRFRFSDSDGTSESFPNHVRKSTIDSSEASLIYSVKMLYKNIPKIWGGG